jgi:hypothetical protein
MRFLTARVLTGLVWTAVCIEYCRGSVFLCTRCPEIRRHRTGLNDGRTADSRSDRLVGLFAERGVLKHVLASSRLLVCLPVGDGAEGTLHASVNDVEAVDV